MEAAAAADLRFLPDGRREDVLRAFASLAAAQRGLPEQLATSPRSNPALFHATGLFTYCAEHVGDLTHRMSEPGCERAAFGFSTCSEKVSRTLRYLRGSYGFDREVNLNISNNHRVEREDAPGFMSLEAYREEFRLAALRYADAHRGLRVWNKAQFHAREAAVSLGELDFFRTETHLAALEWLLESKASWTIACATAWMGDDGQPLPYRPGMEDLPETEPSAEPSDAVPKDVLAATAALTGWTFVTAVADDDPLPLPLLKRDDGSVTGIGGTVTAEGLALACDAGQVRFEDADTPGPIDLEGALAWLSSAREGPFRGLVSAAAKRALGTVRSFAEPVPAASP